MFLERVNGNLIELKAIVAQAKTFVDIFKSLGYTDPDNGTLYKYIRGELDELQISYDHILKGRLSEVSDEIFTKMVNESRSTRELCIKLGYDPNKNGSIQTKAKKRIEQLGLNPDFKGQGWTANSSTINDNAVRQSAMVARAPWDSIFCENSQLKTSNKILLTRLVQSGKKKYKCDICGLHEWNDLPIRLELHHVNGCSIDNRVDNLQILCPTCHSQTDSFGIGANGIKDQTATGRWYQQMLWYSENPDLELALGLAGPKPRKKKSNRNWSRLEVEAKCRCGKMFKPRESKQKFCSIECAQQSQRKVQRPSKEELEQLIENTSWVAIGKMYNVSDNAVRKWAKTYGL